MLSNYSFPKTLKENYIDLDIIGGIQPNTEYALYITCDSTTLTNDCWCGFAIPDYGWSSNSVYYGNNTRYFVLKTTENVNNSKFRIRGDKGVTINHIRLIKLVTNSKYSRIERFLYALYSLDSSDLPIPKSRIEELYNCLVTGAEVPTFKPISRVEKYLMAILGVYDADSLPNPLSRVEVLLYKLATGDDNLDDIKSFLSEHEELLAGIIRNGGINGDISFDDDYEYRGYSFATGQYTLENTAEQPVKSAILKGKTNNNLWSKMLEDVFVQEKTDDTTIEPYSEQYMRITYGETQINPCATVGIETSQPLQANKTYYINTFVFDADDVTDLFLIRDYNNAINLETFKIEGYPAGQILSFTTQVETNGLKFYYYAYTRNYGAVNYGKPFYMSKRFIISDKLEDVVNQEFFEGMKSVENPAVTITGKNLFDGVLELGGLDTATGLPNDAQTDRYRSVNYIKVKPNTSYIFSHNYNATIGVREFDEEYGYSKKWYSLAPNVSTFTTSESAHFIRFIVIGTYSDNQIQLEEGSVATEYEPYKSTTVSCNEDVELLGVGDVKDELDCFTGEVTKRIREVVLDGSEYWNIEGEGDTHIEFSLFGKINDATLNGGTICNKIPEKIGDSEGITVQSFGTYVKISKAIASDVESFKTYLQSNPITVQYELAEPVIKTVDLSVVDQDGNDTELKTFDNSTHVTITSEGPIPESEIEVAKYIPYMTYELTEKETTLYNTKEHSVKSAVLKGNTLVNIVKKQEKPFSHSVGSPMKNNNLSLNTSLKANTLYTRFIHVSTLDLGTTYQVGMYDALMGHDGSYNQYSYTINSTGWLINTFTTKTTSVSPYMINPDTNALSNGLIHIEIDKFMIIEGDYTNVDIPYFEGMKSVKMPVLTTSNEDGTESTTVSCNEDVELHGVGEVKDELDCFTGEVTKRVGEVVFDGSEDWVQSGMGDPTIFYTSINDLAHKENYQNSISCDKFVTKCYEGDLMDSPVPNGITGYFDNTDSYPNQNWFYIKLADSEGSVEKLKQWLSQNPVTVRYELTMESVKTVDLSVVDQDGNNTELKSFDDITYVTLSSEGPIPEAELEVATKNEEVLDTMSLRMDDIYATQTTLEETSNTQSENVDATMVATTEIYEELL